MSNYWLDNSLPDLAEYSYPFFKFFSAETEIDKQNGEAIVKIEEWLNDTSGKGLIIVGPPASGKSHLLYLAALHKVMPIEFAKDLDRKAELAKKNKMYDDYIQEIRELYPAIDEIGSETGTSGLMRDLIESLWVSGKGIVGATSYSPDQLKEKYGEDIINKMMRACIVAPLTRRR